ncbi:MAG: DUF6580 family putative transport protein [Pirellulales bacterium]
MNRARHLTARDLSIFTLLVAIGVAGRWGQPDWEFTPIAAAAVFAGRYFSRVALAALVPLAILVISDLGLPAYDSLPVLFVKYVLMTLPVLFGRLLGDGSRGWGLAWRWGLCGLAPATLFFLTTNLAVWAFESDYPKTLAGLAQCYAAGVPFFRSMLAGDLFYLAVLFGCAALAGERAFRAQPAEQRAKP